MRFLLDRCAGKKLAEWLAAQGHDALDSRDFPQDPGDEALLAMAAAQQRILVTIDTDFGTLLFRRQMSHCGLVRLPDAPAAKRIELMERVLTRYSKELETGLLSQFAATGSGYHGREERFQPRLNSFVI